MIKTQTAVENGTDDAFTVHEGANQRLLEWESLLHGRGSGLESCTKSPPAVQYCADVRCREAVAPRGVCTGRTCLPAPKRRNLSISMSQPSGSLAAPATFKSQDFRRHGLKHSQSRTATSADATSRMTSLPVVVTTGSEETSAYIFA